jgi:hypothetical protein
VAGQVDALPRNSEHDAESAIDGATTAASCRAGEVLQSFRTEQLRGAAVGPLHHPLRQLRVPHALSSGATSSVRPEEWRHITRSGTYDFRML